MNYNTNTDAELSLCIPRVFANIDEKRVRSVIEQLLGKISRVDIIERTNEKGEKYKRVFVHFDHWFETADAQTAKSRLIEGKEIKIVYDDPWFWKVSANKVSVNTRPKQRINLQQPNAKPAPRLEFEEDTTTRSNNQPREPIWYPQEPRYQPRESRYHPQEQRYHPQEQRYHPQEQRYQPQEQRYQPQEPRYQPREQQRYQPREQQRYQPREQQIAPALPESSKKQFIPKQVNPVKETAKKYNKAPKKDKMVKQETVVTDTNTNNVAEQIQIQEQDNKVD